MKAKKWILMGHRWMRILSHLPCKHIRDPLCLELKQQEGGRRGARNAEEAKRGMPDMEDELVEWWQPAAIAEGVGLEERDRKEITCQDCIFTCLYMQ